MKKRVFDSGLLGVFASVTLLLLLFVGCSNSDKSEGKMKISKELFFSSDDGRKAYLYTLSNVNGLEVKITNYGGIITSLKIPDKSGNLDNVVLGFDNSQDYLDGHPYFGAIIGRFANRIANGEFELDGVEYQLSTNEGENHIHGGDRVFDKVVWDAEIKDNRSLRLTYLSKHGEEGYPGNLEVMVDYTLTNEDELKVEYEATTDKSTPVNLTNHSYFNLTGNFAESILNHHLKLYAKRYTPANDEMIPTGEITSVEDTPLDFTELTRIGARIDQVEGGYDHNFVLDGARNELKIAADLYDPASGRKLSLYTTEPGIQLYTGNFLDGQHVSSDGIPYKKHAGLSLEPQHFPNSPNEEGFPSTIIRPGEIFKSLTVYSFSVE